MCEAGSTPVTHSDASAAGAWTHLTLSVARGHGGGSARRMSHLGSDPTRGLRPIIPIHPHGSGVAHAPFVPDPYERSEWMDGREEGRVDRSFPAVDRPTWLIHLAAEGT